MASFMASICSGLSGADRGMVMLLPLDLFGTVSFEAGEQRLPWHLEMEMVLVLTTCLVIMMN